MSYYVVPNIALGMGVILVITLACGTIQKIPCHNSATARHIAASMENNPEVAGMAKSFSTRPIIS